MKYFLNGLHLPVWIEVKNWCTIETNLQGLTVFPQHLSPGPHTLTLTFNASRKLPGTLLTGTISLLSEGENERKEIQITGQIQSPLPASSSLQSKPSPLAPMHWPYQLRDEAARSLLRVLGNDEEKSLVSQLISDRRNYKLKRNMMQRASDLLFDLIGKTALLWYIRRSQGGTQDQGAEEWTLTLAVDSLAGVDDLPETLKSLLKQKKIVRLRCIVNLENRRKFFVQYINFPNIEEGIKDLTAFPALIQLTPFVPEYTYTDIPLELLAQIQELPIKSPHELDRDQLKIWEMWLQIQSEQVNRKQYQAKYTDHTYREGMANIVFTLDKEDVRNYKGEVIPYQEFQNLARKTRNEKLRLVASLPEKGSLKRSEGRISAPRNTFARKTDERVVEKWLSDTAQDCQVKKEKRAKTITDLKQLVVSSQRFSLYCMQETEWSKQQFSLQHRLVTINLDLEEINASITQNEREEQHNTCIHNALSTVLAGSIDKKRPGIQEALQTTFQYLAKTISMQAFTRNVNEGLRIMKQVDLTPPETFSLLECAVWLKVQAHTCNEEWTKGRRIIDQVNNVLVTCSDIQIQLRKVRESLAQIQEQLNNLTIQLRSLQTALDKQVNDRQQLQRAWNIFSDNDSPIVATRLMKWINDEIRSQFSTGHTPKDLEMDAIFSAEIISAIQADPSSMLCNNWAFTKEDVKKYVQKVVITIQNCERTHNRLPLFYQAINQELSALPEINQVLGQTQPVQQSMPENSAIFHELVERIEHNLKTIGEMLLQPSNVMQLLFREKQKQHLHHLFCETRDLLMTASQSRDHIFLLIQNNISDVARNIAEALAASLTKWYMMRKESIESLVDPLEKERLEKKHQSLQEHYQEEEKQLSRTKDELKKNKEELVNQFRNLSQCEGIPGELREVVRQNVLHEATSTEYIEQYRTSSKRWINDIQRLETLVPAIWGEFGSATKKIQQQLQQTSETLGQQKLQRDKLVVEREERQNQLQHEPYKLAEERSWWKTFWETISEDLRPQAPSDGIFSLPFLQELQQQFEIWEHELAKEESFAQRYDTLITDWIATLRNLSESDKQGLRDEYFKNANVVGITCNQAYKLNWKETKQFSSFDVVIIDEVSKATPPEILLPAIKGKKLILIGDRHQLPPMMDDKTFEQLLDENGQDPSAVECLNRPYFAERYQEAPDEIKCMLHIQYRMHPDIMAAINQFYERPLECGLPKPDVQRDHQLESRMIGKNKHIIWLNTPLVSARERNGQTKRISARNARSGYEVLKYQSAFASFGEESNGTSQTNRREAEIITKICQEIHNIWTPKRAAGAEQKEIGIITFYSAQEKLLHDMLKVSRTGVSADFPALNIRIGTVDRFQGMERAIIIVSMVRNNGDGDIGFAKKDERINVAFSRSQQLLILVGCHDLFCVTASGEQAIERYKNVARIVKNRGDFIDVSCL